MFWLERRALKDGLINVELARTGADDAAVDPAVAAQVQAEQRTIGQKVYQLFQEVDTIGLLLLGFGWSLVSFLFAFGGRLEAIGTSWSSTELLVLGMRAPPASFAAHSESCS